MGFMDSFLGGLQKAANEIDKKAGLSGSNSLGNLAGQAKSAYNNAAGGTVSSGGVSSVQASAADSTPKNVLASGSLPIGNYKTVTDEYSDFKPSFELPVTFGGFDSHAEPEMCYLYMFDDSDETDINLNKPYICITPEDYAYNAVESFLKTGTPSGVGRFEKVNTGKMLFKAKNVNYFGKIAYFYGFVRGESDYLGLSMVYCRDAVGTPLENKLIEILDHAAQTYKEC